MNKTDIKYIDLDYIKQIESLKRENRYIFFTFIFLIVTLLMFFWIFQLQNRRIVNVELKLEIYGKPKKERPLMCGI